MTFTKEQQAENRKKWVEALRSGKYEQGKRVLRRGDEFCCLGVACDISDLGSWSKDGPLGLSGACAYTPHSGLMSESLLPDEVRDWLGLRSRLGESSRGGLSAMNDGGVPFSEIADIIESEPEGLLA